MHKIRQLHIDMARNATDDFNLFHDASRWHWVEGNPFNGPIALGFQLALFAETQFDALQTNPKLDYGYYQLNFAAPVALGDELSLVVKPTRHKKTDEGFERSLRFVVKTNNSPAIIGMHRQSTFPQLENPLPNIRPQWLSNFADKSFVKERVFLKRKWMIIGNAKNFLLSAFANQTNYIDEFADKVQLPAMYPLSLSSSALIERAKLHGRDLIKDPLIYTQHQLSIDNKQLSELCSNDCLQMLITEVENDDKNKLILNCTGWVNQQAPLFVTRLSLASLQVLMSANQS